MRKKKNNIIAKNIENLIVDSMLPYAEYVIMDRALPRVEDGLKPVQRRILYSMYVSKMLPSKPFKKTARIVGDCLGKYHPHGDTSVYDATVRMIQDFNMRIPLVEGHGNFGSIDGDPAASMRYTEARLSHISLEMLKDIEKNTVEFCKNFDESLYEPTVLPGKFPNLLVNGASGIAVGLATNIPTHNLREVIDGTIAYINNPKISLNDLMSHIKGPDFPSGGIVIKENIESAYETGKGKLQLVSKLHIEKQKNGKKSIVITEIPYQINKADLLMKISQLRDLKKEDFSDIVSIVDESDSKGIRALIHVKKNTDTDVLIEKLFKNTNLKTTFGVNMVVIAENKPQQLPLVEMIKFFVKHQIDVIRNRTIFDIERTEKRIHILEGYLIALENINDIIELIKNSKTPDDAKKSLELKYNLSAVQSQAILDLKLSKITKLEITSVKKELKEMKSFLKKLNNIIKSDKEINNIIKNELLEIKEKYGTSRKTKIVSNENRIRIKEILI